MSATEETLDHGERLKREVQAMMAPLREHYEEVQAEIVETERKLVGLRSAKTDLLKLIRVSEPGFGGDQRRFNLGGSNGKPKKSGPSKGGHRYKPETIATMTDWFQANAEELNEMNEGEGFYSSKLVKDKLDSLPAIKSQSAMSYMLSELHNRGIVRLAKVDPARKTKFYKVVV